MRIIFPKYSLIIWFCLFVNTAATASVSSDSVARFNSLLNRANLLVYNVNEHDSVTQLISRANQLLSKPMREKQLTELQLLEGLKDYYSSDFAEALDHFYLSLEKSEAGNFPKLKARSLHGIGLIYLEIEENDEAINYFNQSLEISLAIQDTNQFAKTYQNLSVCFRNKNDLKLAREYALKSRFFAQLRKDTARIVDCINNLGTIAYDEQKIDESLRYFVDALDLYRKIGDMQGIATATNNIGLIYLDKKEYKQAYNYFSESLQLANQLKLMSVSSDIYHNLSEYYAERMDFRNAYEFYQKHQQVLDSLMGERKIKLARQIQAKYQLARNQRDIEALETKSQSQSKKIDVVTLRMFYLVGVTLIFILLMVVTIYLLMREKRLAKELKSKTEELLELNLSKDKFFSIIAHDLKNPFNILVSYTSILKTDFEFFSKEELTKIIDDLNHAAENGYNLLQNLLLWTRSQTNRIHIFKTRFNLNVCIENVKALVELNLQAKEQSLVLELEPDLEVYADKEMIATVLRNLVFNAIKFSVKGSEIRISAKAHDSMVTVKVIDSGVGISPESLHNLFSLKKSYSSAGTEGESGTGLGLVICREFIEKNNGIITVESKEGEGSVFSVTIPVAELEN